MLLRIVPWIFLLSCTSAHKANTNKILVGIMPLNASQSVNIDELASQISSFYACKCVVLPTENMPQKAYYKPRNRYRADSILNFLENKIPDSIDVLLALTSFDISTSLKNHHDWGVFGLGRCPGKVCVISDFRLNKSVSNQQKMTRLKNVALHEIGHNFGRQHCGDSACLMKDAKGKLSNVEGVNRKLCKRCHEQIFN